MAIPFLDLRAQYESIKPEIDRALQDVLESCAFCGGRFVESFEQGFAAFCRTEHAVACGSGTDALWLALLALGIGPGDEVITVPNTFMATAEAISMTGATPVFVDVEERTFTMDPCLIETAISPRTKAIIPVHLYGQTADMDPILDIARGHGLRVIEDACQAHGAEYRGRSAGSMGDAGCFSFYPGKNLGAYGEGGAVVTGDPELAAKLRMLRDHGQAGKHRHAVVGWNARMDGFQGAVLGVKLKYLPAWNEARRQVAGWYEQALAGVDGLVLPGVAEERTHVFHIYGVRHPRRDQLMQALADQGVSCGIHYPTPIHFQEAYGHLGYGAGDFPVAEACAAQELSLPIYPELTEADVRAAAASIRSTCGLVGS